jgi:signal transduction histidine kinase
VIAVAGPTIASVSWLEAVTTEPARAVAAAALLAATTVGAAWCLRRLNPRSRSLRRQVLAIALTAVLLGAIASLALTWLMVLDGEDLGLVLTVLVITATTASALVVAATSTLGHDAARLEATVRRVEGGERDVRTGLDRRDELGHVARAVDELTERLGALEGEQARFEAERSEMLASISHDLRTPIAALRAAVEALADGLAPDPDRYLASMQRDVEALGWLVDDLFLLVRLDRGRYEMPASSIDLTEIADEAIEALTPVAEARAVSVHLSATGAVRVNGNAAALGRVIRNLLDNAIRHAPPSSVVSVTVDPVSRLVRVTDEGPGFEASFADTAFEHFTRADTSRNRSTGGAGLGLAIARGVVEAHGGQIWIEPPPGGRVAFELPAA